MRTLKVKGGKLTVTGTCRRFYFLSFSIMIQLDGFRLLDYFDFIIFIAVNLHCCLNLLFAFQVKH